MSDRNRKESSYGYAIQIKGSVQFKRWNNYLSKHRGRDRCNR